MSLENTFKNLMNFLQTHKYEVLLVALVLHLFVGTWYHDLSYYTHVIWPINMIFLGLASIGIFNGKNKNEIRIKNILLLMVTVMPLLVHQTNDINTYLKVASIIYTLFFIIIFYEVFVFLIKPEEFNVEVLSASACGYLLLIEIFTYFLQFLFYTDNDCLIGINNLDPAITFMDLVYFTTITLTTIGYGDIIPNNHQTKLLVSFMGLLGQFYTVILTGIIIANFAPNFGKRKNKRAKH